MPRTKHCVSLVVLLLATAGLLLLALVVASLLLGLRAVTGLLSRSRRRTATSGQMDAVSVAMFRMMIIWAMLARSRLIMFRAVTITPSHIFMWEFQTCGLGFSREQMMRTDCLDLMSCYMALNLGICGDNV
jgi:hypothetical protein